MIYKYGVHPRSTDYDVCIHVPVGISRREDCPLISNSSFGLTVERKLDQRCRSSA